MTHSFLLNPHYWQDISQRYMESAAIFLSHGMYEQCRSVAEMALHAMLKAYWLKKKGMLPESAPTLGLWSCHADLLVDLNQDSDLLLSVFHVQGSFINEDDARLSAEQTSALLGQVEVFIAQLSLKVVEERCESSP